MCGSFLIALLRLQQFKASRVGVVADGRTQREVPAAVGRLPRQRLQLAPHELSKSRAGGGTQKTGKLVTSCRFISLPLAKECPVNGYSRHKARVALQRLRKSILRLFVIPQGQMGPAEEFRCLSPPGVLCFIAIELVNGFLPPAQSQEAPAHFERQIGMIRP